jgi:hypothetical protein
MLIKIFTKTLFQVQNRARERGLALTIKGIRINELLPLKVSQLETLLQKNWIEINRSKRGPVSHKAYLTGKGKKFYVNDKKILNLYFG